MKIDYTFMGWNHAINFLSEVQLSNQHANTKDDPVKLVRQASYAALCIASVIFLFLNISYFAAVPKDVLRNSGSLVGAMFCESVYGKDSFVAVRMFPTFVALSCVGGLISTVCELHQIGSARH